MTTRLSTLLATGLVVAALTACGSGEDAAGVGEDTSATARGLLSSVPGEGERSVPEQEGVSAPVQDFPVDDLGHDFGDPDAPVRIVELSDYGCGYCRRFHQETWPAIKERYIDTGKVHWKFLPFITGMFNNSLTATEAAECGQAQGEEPFLALSGRLWADQAAWKSGGDPDGAVRTMAREAGVSMNEWDACMADNRRIDRVRAATSIAQDLGVRGTPTFFVMGYPPLQGALPTETFSRILDMVYTEATRQEEDGGA